MALTERDEELQMQSTLNRQLKQSLDVATKPPEQKDITTDDYDQLKKEEKENLEAKKDGVDNE